MAAEDLLPKQISTGEREGGTYKLWSKTMFELCHSNAGHHARRLSDLMVSIFQGMH